jgi:uncharacterized protein YbdZ (MbtH family)
MWCPLDYYMLTNKNSKFNLLTHMVAVPYGTVRAYYHDVQVNT